MDNTNIFASKNLAEHLLRGALGVGAIWFALSIAQTQSIVAIMLGGVALWAFRGCPLCWTMGLFQTARQTLRRLGSRSG